jgi:hypothetical protein
MEARSNQNRSGLYLGRVSNMADRTVGLGDRMAQTGQGLVDRWGNRIDSSYGAATEIANKEPTWYADRAAVTSNRAFDESKGVQDRTLSRMGINPNSGRFVGLQTKWGLARAAAEAGARTRAAQDSEATRFSRLQTLLGVGNQGLGQGANLLSGAGGAYSRAGSEYSELAGDYDRLAEESATWGQQNQPESEVGLKEIVSNPSTRVVDDKKGLLPYTPAKRASGVGRGTGYMIGSTGKRYDIGQNPPQGSFTADERGVKYTLPYGDNFAL